MPNSYKKCKEFLNGLVSKPVPGWKNVSIVEDPEWNECAIYYHGLCLVSFNKDKSVKVTIFKFGNRGKDLLKIINAAITFGKVSFGKGEWNPLITMKDGTVHSFGKYNNFEYDPLAIFS